MPDISSAPPPSSNRTSRFPASSSHANTHHQHGRHITQHREAVTLQSPQRESLMHPTGHLSSVAGFAPKRFSSPLTKACLHQAPSLHGRYAFLRYYEPIRLPIRACWRLCLPASRWWLAHHPAGSPRFLD